MRSIRRALLCAIILFIALSPRSSASDQKDDTAAVEKFMASRSPASTARLSVTAALLRDLVNPLAADKERWDLFRSGGKPENFISVDTIFAEYQRRAWQDRMDAAQYGAAGLLINGAVIVGSAFVPQGSIPAIAGGFASAGANAGASSAIGELTEHGQKQTSAWLEAALSNLVTGNRLDENLSQLTRLSPEERRQWLIEENLVNQLLEKAPEARNEDKPIVQGMLLRALDNKIRRGETIQRDRDKEQDAKITEQAIQINAVARSLNEFRQETESQIEGIRREQKSLNDRLDTIANDTAKNRDDIDFLQRFMFEKMSPREQLAALRSGMFSDMPEADRTRLMSKIELVEQRERLISTVADFSQGAAAAARIAGRLNVDAKVVSAIQKGAEVSAAAQKAFAGIASGGMGYLAAADAITGLVFGNGPDPGAQRHAEIMGALSEIKQGIVEIQQMLIEMSKQLAQIEKLQRTTLETLVKVSEQIQSNHREAMSALADIRNDLVPIASILSQQLFQDIERCSVFRRRLEDNGFRRDRLAPSMTYGLLRSIDYTDRHGEICRAGLSAILSNPFGPEITYDLKRFKGALDSDTSRFLTQVYEPTWELISTFVILAGAASPYVRSFALPLSDIRALDIKRRELFDKATHTPRSALAALGDGEIRRRLGTPLSTHVIERHAQFLGFSYPFFEMAEALRQQNPAALISAETTSIEGRELLRTTVELVEVAIAQQTMLAGDAALADLDKIWRAGSGPKQANESDIQFARRIKAFEQLQKVIRANAALRHNLILHSVSRSLRTAGEGSALRYGFAHGMAGDPIYLHELLPEPHFNIVWRAPPTGERPRPDPVDARKSTGWHLRFGESDYPLPTVEELSSGALVHTPDLRRLLDLRNYLQAELDGFRVSETLTPQQHTALKKMIWRVSDHYRQ